MDDRYSLEISTQAVCYILQHNEYSHRSGLKVREQVVQVIFQDGSHQELVDAIVDIALLMQKLVHDF